MNTQNQEHAGGHWLAYVFLVSFVAAVGGFIFGYDLNIAAGAQSYLRDYFDLDAGAFGFAMSSALIGCFFGPIAGAWVCDAIGRKRSLILAALLFGVSAIGTALPQNIVQFNIFRLIGGVGVGLAGVASPMYISEVAPKNLRGRLVTMNQLAIVVGSLCAIIGAYFMADRLDPQVSWRWMFGSEMVPILIFVFLLMLLPETPRWLAERRRFDEAKAVLLKVNGPEEAALEIEGIEQEIAREEHAPRVELRELLAPGIRVAIIVGVVLSLLSQWTGWSMTAFYMPTIYAQAGIADAAEAVKWTIIPNVANLGYTLVAIWLVDLLGRRPLYLVCTLAMTVTMSLVGMIFIWNIQGWPVVLILSLTAAPHAIGLGALSWLVVSEIFPTRIRAKAMGFCTIFLWGGCWAATYSAPLLFELSQQWFGVPSAVFFLCAFVSFLGFVFVFKMLPETKGRTLEEIADSWRR